MGLLSLFGSLKDFFNPLRVFSVLLFLCVVTAATAYDFSINSIYYTILEDGESVEVSTSGTSDSEYSGEISIPATVEFKGESYIVTQIGKKAFENSNVTSVNLPDGIKLIGERAFYGCKSIYEFVIPNSVSQINASAFDNCTELKNIKLSSHLKKLSIGTFANCENLTEITIPASVTTIEYSTANDKSGIHNNGGVFRDCLKLTNVIFEDGNQKILFSNVWSGNPTSETFYGKDVFWNCPITNLYLGRDLGNVPYNSIFTEITTLKNIEIGKNVTLLQNSAFNGCDNIKEIKVNTSTPPVASEYAFSTEAYHTTKLCVPSVALTEFENAICWKNFTNIESFKIASNLSIEPAELELYVGDISQLEVLIEPEDTDEVSVAWSSNDERVALVDEYGTVTALSVGEALITASFDDISANCKITVLPIEASSIHLNIQEVDLMPGESITLEAYVLPENATDKNINWSTENPTIADVTQEGVVSGISNGICNIIASCGQLSAMCRINVGLTTDIVNVPYETNNIEIYSIDGTLIENTSINKVCTLKAGIYIIHQGTFVGKLLIRSTK